MEKIVYRNGKKYVCKTRGEFIEQYVLSIIDCKNIATYYKISHLEDLIKDADETFGPQVSEVEHSEPK